VTVAVMIALLAGVVSACASKGSSDAADSAAVEPSASGVMGEASSAAQDGAAVAQSGGAPAAPTDAPSFAVDLPEQLPGPPGRAVVSTATVVVRADDIAAAKEQAAATVEAAGGYVFGEQGQFGDHPSVTVTMKVPPERFRSVLASLGRIGVVERQDVETDDVTEQVIDLDSRIASAEASVERVRSFLDRATNVIEISSFEAELLRRETDLEKLRGQKRSLDNRIDLATIVLTVQPPVAAPVEPPPEPDDLPGFVDGLAAGWDVFVGAGTVFLAVTGALLPFAPLLLLVGLAVYWARRRQSRRRTGQPQPNAAGSTA
jgi:hypothetical protein